ncbi:MAG: ABC transporter substrate-binding protein [Candidatus Wallbacteria bacterium]|nr:ABC transporter substrate-binding protein [Candidatus Wallbacteria bacterium]
MMRDPAWRFVGALVCLALVGLGWVLIAGPSGQGAGGRVQGDAAQAPSAGPRALHASTAPVAAQTSSFELPPVDANALPVRPFAAAGEVFTDNLKEPYQYMGPGRDLDDEQDPDVVKLGLVAQLTGSAAYYGLAMQRGVDMAVYEANEQGGYQGKKFVVVPRDDLFDMGANANAMVKLIFEDRVRAIIGAVHSGNTHVGVRLALKCEVPQITSVSTDPTITEVQIPWAFRCLADDRLQGRALAAYMFGKKGYRRVALLNQQSKYGRMGILEIRSLARRLGREVLLQMSFTGGQKDFSGIAERLVRLKPDAVVIWGLYREAALLVKALRERGVAAPVLGGDGLVAPIYPELAGAAAEGTVVTYPFDSERDDPLCREFLKRYREKYGHDADSFSAHAYDATRIVIESIRKVGTNRARIRDAMAATRDFPGVTGPITLDGSGNLVGEVKLAVVEGGKFRKLGEGGDGGP